MRGRHVRGTEVVTAHCGLPKESLQTSSAGSGYDGSARVRTYCIFLIRKGCKSGVVEVA